MCFRFPKAVFSITEGCVFDYRRLCFVFCSKPNDDLCEVICEDDLTKVIGTQRGRVLCEVEVRSFCLLHQTGP